jgi:PleD family two-component response regulator
LGELYNVLTLPGVSSERNFKDLLNKTKPDAFILDYNMPKFTGFDLVPIIRSIRGHKETPVLFLTSDHSAVSITTAITLGACDYIIKPIDEVILRKKIAKHLEDFLIQRRIRSLGEADKR